MMTIHGLSFVAIDFETANEQRGSACQVGMAKVIKGEVVETVGWYTVPPTGIESFSPWNVNIHKITSDDVADGYTWDESVEAIADYVGDLPLVAHNASFDKSVYQKSCEMAGILPFDHNWHCSLKLAGRLRPDGPTKLKDVAKHFGIDTPNHHDAKHDAAVAAQIVILLAQLSSVASFEELWPPAGKASRPSKRPSSTPQAEWFSRAGSARKEDIPKPNPDALPGHALHGQHFVITGELATMERWDAWTLAAELGAQPQKNVTKKTTMIVVALQEEITDDYDPRNGSGTERKAGERQASGQPIRFMGGSEFLALLGSGTFA